MKTSKSFLIIFCLTLVGWQVTSAEVSVIQERIVGGSYYKIRSIPYVVSITILKKPVHNCGGTILATKFALTAAHCTHYRQAILDDMQVRAGSTYCDRGGVLIKISRIIEHPDYNADDHRMDVSLLVLARDLRFSKNIRPIALATVRSELGTLAKVSGWGYVSETANDNSPQLKSGVIQIESCRKLRYPLPEAPDRICAAPINGSDSCFGDSGGPVVVADRLVGIVSFGVECGMGSANTDVAAVRQWILDAMDSVINPQ